MGTEGRSPTIDGRAIRGADSLAASALASRRILLSRSFRLHRPRGPFCGRGYCQQCPVLALRGPGVEETVLACLTPAGPETRVRTVGRPNAGRDAVRAVGSLAERWPPWFQEQRFLRPRFLRQAYLRVLRRLSAAPPLPAGPPPVAGAQGRPEVTCDVVVVGGGPGGLAAAVELAASGARVLILEADRLGGSWRWLPGAAGDLAELLEEVRASAVEVLAGTTCLGWYEEEGIAAAVGPSGPLAIRAERLVAATGAYDRLLPFRGNDLPGVIGVRAFERYVAEGAFGRWARIGVYAAPEEAGRAIRAAEEASVCLGFVAGPAALPDAGVEALPGTGLVRALGRRRLRAVQLSDGVRRSCDILVLGFSQPTFELQLQAGAVPEVEGEPALLRPRVDGRPILEVGEAAGEVDPRVVAPRAREAVRAWLDGTSPRRADPPRLPLAARRDDDAFLCPCEDVRVRDVRRAVQDGFDDVELVKRRTGFATGACQGKLCLAEGAALLAELGFPPGLPTTRPPLRPVDLAALAVGDG